MFPPYFITNTLNDMVMFVWYNKRHSFEFLAEAKTHGRPKYNTYACSRWPSFFSKCSNNFHHIFNPSCFAIYLSIIRKQVKRLQNIQVEEQWLAALPCNTGFVWIISAWKILFENAVFRIFSKGRILF